MMIGHMEHTCLGVAFISALEIISGIHAHIGSGNVDVAIVGNVHSGRVVHFIICACGYREGTDSTFAVVEHGVDIRRKYRAIAVVDSHSRISPPKEGLGNIGGIGHYAVNLQIGASGAERKSGSAFLMSHALKFVHPHCDAPVGSLLNVAIHLHICARTVVLRPVELYPSRNPRSGQPYESRFDHTVVVDEMTLLDFVVCHLHTTAELRKNHHLDIFVLKIDGRIFAIGLFVGH